MLRKKAVITIASFISLNLLAVDELNQLQLTKVAVFASHKLSGVDLFHAKDGFHVAKNNQLKKIEPCFIDKSLRVLTEKQIRGFQKHGYFELNELSDGNYSLKARVRGQGGGPLTGSFLYWITKATAYGGIAAAGGSAVFATGGAAAAALGGGSAATFVGGAAAAGIGYGASGTALGAAMTSGGATVIAGGIATSATATSAAGLATGAGLAASGGCVATMMGGIETAALFMGTLGTLCPWLP